MYGLEIMHLNKKTINMINLSQNTIMRYMTGLSKNSHISDVLKIGLGAKLKLVPDYTKNNLIFFSYLNFPSY